MEELDLILSLSIDRYFNILSESGYHSYNDTDYLIALIGIRDILKYFSDYVTDEDLRYIINAIHCLENSCLIKFPARYSNDSLLDILNKLLKFRVTESGVLRIVDTENLKVF